MRILNKVYLEWVLPFSQPTSFRGISTRFRYYEQLEDLSLEENEKRQWESLTSSPLQLSREE